MNHFWEDHLTNQMRQRLLLSETFFRTMVPLRTASFGPNYRGHSLVAGPSVCERLGVGGYPFESETMLSRTKMVHSRRQREGATDPGM